MSARVRLLAGVAVVAVSFATALVVGVPHSPEELRAMMSGFGVLAPVAFVLLWTALTPAMFSGTLLAAGAGLLFGIWPGFAVGVAGATLGGVAAFLLARRLGHDAAQELLGPRLRRLQERIERRGLLAVVGARAAPGIPTTVLNYACGLSRVRLWHFALGSLVGGAPRIFAYTAIGGSGGEAGSALVVIAVALIATMALAGLVVALRSRRSSAPAPR